MLGNEGRLMSRTQLFTKLMRHLDQSRRLILLNQPYSQCLACQAKTLATRKLQKAQQAILREQKLLLLKEAFTSALRTHLLGQEVIWVVPWPNEGLTYLQALMELSGTLEGSLQIKNILELPTLIYVQPYVQEYTRNLQNSLESPRLLSCLPPQCRDVWTSLDISRTFHTLPTNDLVQMALGVSRSFLDSI